MIFAIKYIFISCPVRILLLVALLCFQGVLPGLNLLLTGKIINGIQAQSYEQYDFIITVAFWCVSLLGVQCLQPLVNLIQGDVNEITTRYFNENIMKRMNSSLTLTLFEEKERHEQLDLLRREAAYRPLNFIVTSVFLLRSLIMITGLLIILVKYSGLGPAICAFSVIPLLYINIKVEQRNWRNLLLNSKESIVMRYVYDTCMERSHLQEIRVYKLGEFLLKKYSAAAENMFLSMHKQRLYALLMPVPMIIISLCFLFIGVYIFLNTLRDNALSVSTIVVAFQSVIMLKSYLDDMASNGGHIFSLTSFFKTYHEFMNGFIEPVNNGLIRLPKGNSLSININNLSFKYPGRENLTLNGLSLKIKSGEKIAILGDNGSGKTTLLKLILRMYDSPTETIFISGEPIERLDIEEYRDNVSIVFQEYGKYEFTVKENIVFNDDASDIEIKKLLDEVELNLSPSDQLGKRFGGGEISIGQWQKLAIARALSRKASLFIFDEFSSSLDPEIEYKLFNKILSVDSTIIAVTHRLGKIKAFDRIIVMDNGDIIEDGDFNSLIEAQGKFYEMWKAQFNSLVEGKNE